MRRFLWAGVLLVPLATQAEVFRCVDRDGRVIYTGQQDGRMTCTPVSATINVVPAPPPMVPAARPPADTTPADIDQEIAATEQELAAARQALREQESIRLGGEQNYQRVLDRLKPYQDKVTALEKRLEELRARKRRQ